jgi:hypothetical protein
MYIYIYIYILTYLYIYYLEPPSRLSLEVPLIEEL